MSCMLSLKTVAKGKKEKLDFTYRCRYHSLAGEPTEKNSQALQQANFALVFTLLVLYPGGCPGRFPGVVYYVVHISQRVCVNLRLFGEGGGRFFF